MHVYIRAQQHTQSAYNTKHQCTRASIIFAHTIPGCAHTIVCGRRLPGPLLRAGGIFRDGCLQNVDNAGTGAWFGCVIDVHRNKMTKHRCTADCTLTTVNLFRVVVIRDVGCTVKLSRPQEQRRLVTVSFCIITVSFCRHSIEGQYCAACAQKILDRNTVIRNG